MKGSSVVMLLTVLATALILSEGAIIQNRPGHVNLSCSFDQTECYGGCCPYANAVCCTDQFECCPAGTTCIPYVGICVGIDSNGNDKPTLVSSKSKPLQNKVTSCPSGTTTCADDKCCMMPNAVCCSDGEHCCPAGYSCDLSHQQCVRVAGDVGLDSIAIVDQTKTIKKPAYTPCAGDALRCPSYTNCCHIKGHWSCCARKENGDCCDTIFGYMCCPDDYPVCTIFGCTN